MDLSTLLTVTAATVLTAVVVLWLVSLAVRDASVADVAWGPLFVVVASLCLVLGAGWAGRRILVFVLVTAWGLRLGVHIGLRNRGRGEDPRYARWREEHGRAWPWVSLAKVFLLQGALLWVISLPAQVAAAMPGPGRLTLLDAVGCAVWLVGFTTEVVADAQLRRFLRRREAADAFLTSGLWRYSRHPNYFGEAVLWWGIGLTALSVPGGWTTLVGPLCITLLLRFVSGVPMTEERMEGRPGWDAYAARTPAFVPLPRPRR
ncbi:MAG: DUF1295 domain-containing protein [Gemmatimonadota bacterium]|jgi:steroid 5-alpha reductase family enzyme